MPAHALQIDQNNLRRSIQVGLLCDLHNCVIFKCHGTHAVLVQIHRHGNIAHSRRGVLHGCSQHTPTASHIRRQHKPLPVPAASAASGAASASAEPSAFPSPAPCLHFQLQALLLGLPPWWIGVEACNCLLLYPAGSSCGHTRGACICNDVSRAVMHFMECARVWGCMACHP